MTLSVVSRWYNESALARLWCEHYMEQGADALHVIIDPDTDDDCADIASSCGANIIDGADCGGFDEAAKMAEVNAVAAQIAEGYVLVVDSDEFAYSPVRLDLARHLLHFPAQCHAVQYWQAYRHETEGPIDGRPVLAQRRHGMANPFGQGHWCKPALVAAACRPQWGPGHHSVTTAAPLETVCDLRGAHWAMADVDLAIKRRLRARARMSRRNYQTGMTSHNWNITEAEIRRECAQHLNDGAQI
jgi:hypothetical protein